MIRETFTYSEMQSLGPNTDYTKLLKERYNVDVPSSAPKYQAEYLYKYARNTEVDPNITDDELITHAAKKAEEFFVKFPWISMKYNDLKKVEENTSRHSKSIGKRIKTTDGTAIWCDKRQKFSCYLNGKVVTRRPTMEKVKAYMTSRYNYEGPFDVIHK